MLLISEVVRTVAHAIGYAIAQRRIGLLVILIAAGLVVLLSTTATTLAPVAIYPFL